MGCDLFQSPAFSLRDKGQREKDTEDTEGSGEPEGTIGLEDLLERGERHVWSSQKSEGPTQFRSTPTTAFPARPSMPLEPRRVGITDYHPG